MFKRKAAMMVTVVALVVVGSAISAAAYTYSYVGSASGWLSGSGDSEIIEATLTGGRRYKVVLDGPWNADFDLGVFDRNGNMLVSGTGTSSDETVYFTPRWSGTFRILVVSYRGYGSFTVKVYRRN